MAAERDTGEDWIREAVRLAIEELRLFLRTLIEFMRHPSAFARAWANGASRPMNPFGFLGGCLIIGGPVQYLLLQRVQPALDAMALKNHRVAWVTAFMQSDLARAALSYLSPVILGLLFHPFLRLFGSRRPLSTTLGVLLYTSGPRTLASWVLLPYLYFYALASPQLAVASGRESLASVVTLPLTAFYIAFGLSGAHGLRASRTILAFALGVIVLSAILVGAGVVLGHALLGR